MSHVVCLGEAALVPQFLLKMSRAEFHGKPVIKLSKEGWAVPAISYLARLSFDLCAGLFETADSWVCNQLLAQNQFKETLQIKFLFALCFVSFALYDLTSPFTKCGPRCSGSRGGDDISASFCHSQTAFSWVIHTFDGLSIHLLI